jgi:N-acetylmuramoyl-L-alanine amidase
MAYDNYNDHDLLALCIWREARNQPHAAKFAVGCSIRNRVQHPRWWGRDYRSVILDPWQYSSFNANDPNANKFPGPLDEPAYSDCESCATDVLNGVADNSNGAVSYFDQSLDAHPPSWAASAQFQHCSDLGAFHFYSLA